MSKLNFSLDGNLLAEYPIDKERITIGRRAVNDIHIDNMAVSGEHAVIITISGDSFLEDMGSTNGTTVNGKPIKKYVLQHLDVIEFGKYQLTYINENQASLSSALTPPALGDKKAEEKAQEKTESQSMSAALPKAAALRIISGDKAGTEIKLSRALVTLGKAGDQLALVTRRPQGYFLTHVEGKQLPKVNGKPITLQAHPLNDADMIEVADAKMEFYYEA